MLHESQVLADEAKVTGLGVVWLNANFLAPQCHREQPCLPQWSTPKLTVRASGKSELCYQLLPQFRPVWGEAEGPWSRRQQTPRPSPLQAQSRAC